MQLDLDRLDYYTNQLVAASQSLTLPARICITTSADGAFNFGLGNFYLRQVILTSPTVATWVLGRNLTDTPNTTNAAFKAGMDALPQSSYYPDSVSYPKRLQSVALQNGYTTNQYMLECRASRA